MDYIAEVQEKLRLRNPQQAIDAICKRHAEIFRSPLERATAKIMEAADELNPNNTDQKLILGLACRALEYSRKGHPVKQAILDALEPFDRVEGILEAGKKKEVKNV